MDARLTARLAQLRGPFPAAQLSARRVAAALETPGCARRLVLDATNADVDKLGVVLGGQVDRQSPFAITRGNRFEGRLTDGDGMPDIVALVRQHLGLDIVEVRQADLSREAVQLAHGDARNELRALLTRQHVARMLAGDSSGANLLRHPMTSLVIGGVTAWLEQDVLAFASAGRLHVVEIKSFPCIDDRPDPEKVSAAARQTAVYLLSLMELAETLGFDRSAVSTQVLLIMPKDLGFVPIGKVVDARLPLKRLRRQLRSVPDIAPMVEAMPAGLALPPHPGKDPLPEQADAARHSALEVVSAIPAKFGDSCLRCPLFRTCRGEAEAQGLTARLGNDVASACGDVATIDRALALAEGRCQPGSDNEAALAAMLSRGAATAALLSPTSA